MKIRKSKFVIIKLDNDRYTIALRKFPDHPLDRNGFPSKNAANARLNQYIRNVNKTI